MSPVSQRPRKPMNPVPVYDRHAPLVSELIADRGPHKAGLSGRTAALIGAGAATAGGTAYLVHRHRSKKKDAMSKNLVNPFEEVVVFGKAYPVALPVPSSTTIRALVPTGSHVGHGNDLKVVRNSKGKGGRRAGLEHYRGGHAKQSMGPFGKSAARGLAQIAAMPKPSSVPAPGRTAGRLVRASRLQASKAPARNEAMAQLRTKVNFGDAGSKGNRLA